MFHKAGKRLAVGAGLIAASVGGTIATIELCIHHTKTTAKEERLEWETNLKPLRALAEAKMTEAASDKDLATLRHVLARVARGEAAVQGREADVVEMQKSWNEVKDDVCRWFWPPSPPDE